MQSAKEVIKTSVDELLALKNLYKEKSGKDFPSAPAAGGPGHTPAPKNATSSKPKAEVKANDAAANKDTKPKKEAPKKATTAAAASASGMFISYECIVFPITPIMISYLATLSAGGRSKVLTSQASVSVPPKPALAAAAVVKPAGT
jgi:hypothetical protein